MSHPALSSNEQHALYEEVKFRALRRLEIEGLKNDERLLLETSKYYNKPLEFALNRLSFYMCYKCSTPYFGGLRDCEQEAQQEQQNTTVEYNPDDLICGECASGKAKCEKHTEGEFGYIEFKCRFCCSIATWFCNGRVHYCDTHHNNPCEYIDLWGTGRLKSEPPQCEGPDKCPLGIDHPPNGTEYCLGCAMCRSEEREEKERKAKEEAEGKGKERDEEEGGKGKEKADDEGKKEQEKEEEKEKGGN
eukprot:CAMPEP_0174265340 /NCGR_PEP_ID=MMETSP0439-20130205/26099_1 /TAXON_ID=0 /ORGANISM="Stereomyxa ramosa, Strain Chinc5" /LENGTH=246 /DNA_ID=CAMNT_0015351751 /DNA_START=1061 /DNA_END=1801 /DNA_ORIENTATION=-